MEIFINEDKTVTKYVHKDGSETSIKHLDSCKEILNPITNKMEAILENRKKFTIFISTSRGCFMECKFCHLTMKSAQYKKLSTNEVLLNLKEAIKETLSRNNFLKDYYVKMSWMGMGDALNESLKVKEVSLSLYHWMIENNYCAGLDGVDLSTTYPNINDLSWKENFNSLNEELKKLELNKNNNTSVQSDSKFSKIGIYKNRSPFRLFFSIHSTVQKTREALIPNAKPLQEAVSLLLEESNKYNIIFHHMFLHGVNDTSEELTSLVNFCKENLKGKELRILRYNECNWSFFHESETFSNLIKNIEPYLDILKVQISPGSEIKAACGQFIVKDYIRKK